MATLTFRIPDDLHNGLKAVAKHQKISLNRMFEHWAAYVLGEQAARQRFEAMKTRGSATRGLTLLDQLDQHFGNPQK